MKIAVITCITGGADFMQSQVRQKRKADYFCFTDNLKRKKCKPWNVIKADCHMIRGKHSDDPLYIAKWYKMQSHKIPILKKYDYHVWIDGSVEFKHNKFLSHMIYLTKKGLILFRHPWRDCIFSEGKRGKSIPKFRSVEIGRQLRHYKIKKYPYHKSLYCGTVIGRKINSKINPIMDGWWNEVLRRSPQDQISLPYVLWANKLEPDIFPGDIYNNMYMEKHAHTALYTKKSRGIEI